MSITCILHALNFDHLREMYVVANFKITLPANKILHFAFLFVQAFRDCEHREAERVSHVSGTAGWRSTCNHLRWQSHYKSRGVFGDLLVYVDDDPVLMSAFPGGKY